MISKVSIMKSPVFIVVFGPKTTTETSSSTKGLFYNVKITPKLKEDDNNSTSVSSINEKLKGV